MQTIINFPKITVIKPDQPLESGNAIEFQDQVKTAVIQEDSKNVLVDFEQVESLDSEGLMALIHGLRFAQTLNRRLGICNLSPSIRMIFELTQLDRVFEIFENKAAFESTIAYM